MKYAFVTFRVNLLGSKPFVINTDHASLRTATQSPHLSQRMARWLSFFVEVKYEPGKQNALADACHADLTMSLLMSRRCRCRLRILFARLRQGWSLHSFAIFPGGEEYKDRTLSCRHACVQAYIDVLSIKRCCSIVQMQLIRRALWFRIMRTSNIASSMRRMTLLLVVISVMRRPMAWYARFINGSKGMSGTEVIEDAWAFLGSMQSDHIHVLSSQTATH